MDIGLTFNINVFSFFLSFIKHRCLLKLIEIYQNLLKQRLSGSRESSTLDVWHGSAYASDFEHIYACWCVEKFTFDF